MLRLIYKGVEQDTYKFEGVQNSDTDKSITIRVDWGSGSPIAHHPSVMVVHKMEQKLIQTGRQQIGATVDIYEKKK
jgi:hypothetical protein